MHVQIVKFELKPHTSRDLFLQLTREMIAWLKGREGFMAYELYEGDGFWFDRIAWENQGCAQAGLNAFLTTPLAQRMTSLVENGYSSFFGETVATE